MHQHSKKEETPLYFDGIRAEASGAMPRLAIQSHPGDRMWDRFWPHLKRRKI